MNDEVATCQCEAVQELAAAPDSPVVFEPRFGEYHLLHGHGYELIRFCHWCGGALPPSRRGDFFLEPDPDEIASLRGTMEGVRTVEELVTRLGQPDHTFERKDSEPTHRKELVWRRQFRFSRHWSSLDVVVLELPTGEVRYVFAGKPKPDEGSSAG